MNLLLAQAVGGSWGEGARKGGWGPTTWAMIGFIQLSIKYWIKPLVTWKIHRNVALVLSIWYRCICFWHKKLVNTECPYNINSKCLIPIPKKRWILPLNKSWIHYWIDYWMNLLLAQAVGRFPRGGGKEGRVRAHRMGNENIHSIVNQILD